ncbi:MAG: GNAT family N-acetyltransferase [Proteobacteria bacterium]|nr:GNAT family N-acetyltransferase [Pseudomonadota bacterium]
MPEFELADGVSGLPREQWNALVGDESPFLEWEFLASLEQSGCADGDCGWLPRPLVAREHGRLVAACPIYVKGNSEGEFVFDWSWADAAARAGIDYYPKLLVGVPFTPVAGARLLVAPEAPRAQWQSHLAAALRQLCVDNDLSGAHVNFCREDELAPLEAAGFQTRVGVQYHWHNHGYDDFEAFLADFRSKRRNQIRRERRALSEQGVRLVARTGDEIGDEWFEPMFRFYRETVQNHFYGRQYLNRDFFERMRDHFRHRLVFIVAMQGDEPVAGTFNVVKGEALYGRYWGASRPLRHLHFNVCYYAAAEFCIEHGLARFEPGAGGDYKQVRGFDAHPTYSAHFLTDARLAHAVGRFLDAERRDAHETVEWLRERSALKPTRERASETS